MTGNEAFVLAEIDAADTGPLRGRVLRPGSPAAATVFLGDDHPQVVHLAARVGGPDGPIIAVGTIFPDGAPWAAGRPDSWRIRGMATDPAWRGRGAGRLVLDGLLDSARAGAGTLVWCHARVGAWGFYRRAGFTAVGAVFHDGIADHQSMVRPLP